ncbi:segregation/condensation protein A [Cyanobium gracile UHCC 0139]|uniref:Segregation and condensation protein A n=1 Tax=Cyanobium gracile UHCC 0139 TaxID=3110308 RepID=A0ABU5RNN2_9CYAN|nr:segregation/condensation protein A [Cyanobium gracile]MEA5389669.1 segregation/condensation protein A [Cyanobium gracile UHCC 0139]
MAEAGARLAIRLLQDAAERGDIDPWDVDVIAVVDGFLDQLRQRIELPRRLAPRGGSYEQDLAESSEAFLAASVLVGLKAELLESATFPPEPMLEDPFAEEDGGWDSSAVALPRRPERHLQRRPVAPPPLQRPVTLGELIRQLEDIAERLERDGGEGRPRPRHRRYSERAAIAQVASLAHREKLPETTAALSRFLLAWAPTAETLEWVAFDALVGAWAEALSSPAAGSPEDTDLDSDRVGVFWALLFLSSQGKVELAQDGGLYGPLSLRRHRDERSEAVSLPRLPGQGSDRGPAREALAA